MLKLHSASPVWMQNLNRPLCAILQESVSGSGEIAMEAVLRALNHLVEAHIIDNYAIGGAIGASFYIDAMQTEDVDAFTVLPAKAGGLVSLEPIYEKLVSLGGVVDREYIRFGEWPLQILTDANALLSDAISSAIAVHYGGVPTRVFTAEHLCAVAIQTERQGSFESCPFS